MVHVGSSLAVAAVLLVSATTIGARAAAARRTVAQSDHEPAGAREVTYEEAHDLLTAFLKLRPLAVEKSGDVGYKEFYFFMADMGSLPCRPALDRAKKEFTLGTSSTMLWTEERATSGMPSCASEL